MLLEHRLKVISQHDAAAADILSEVYFFQLCTLAQLLRFSMTEAIKVIEDTIARQ